MAEAQRRREDNGGEGREEREVVVKRRKKGERTGCERLEGLCHHCSGCVHSNERGQKF